MCVCVLLLLLLLYELWGAVRACVCVCVCVCVCGGCLFVLEQCSIVLYKDGIAQAGSRLEV